MKSRTCIDYCKQSDTALEKTFGRYGELIGSNHRCCIGTFVVTLLVAIVCAAGLSRYTLETDIANLWVQSNSRVTTEKALFDSAFAGLPRALYVLLQPRNPTAPALTSSALQRLLTLTGALANTTTDPQGVSPTYTLGTDIFFNYKGRKYGLREVCIESELDTSLGVRGPCNMYSALDCFKEGGVMCPATAVKLAASKTWIEFHNYSIYDSSSLAAAVSSDCRLWSDTLGTRKSAVLGRAKHSEGWADLRALGFVLPLHNPTGLQAKMKKLKSYEQFKDWPLLSLEDAEAIAEGFDQAISDHFDKFNSIDEQYYLAWINDLSIDDMIRSTSNSNIWYLAVGAALMVAYVVFSLFRVPLLQSHVMLGLAALAVVVLAVAAGSGLGTWFGVKWNLLSTQVMPYTALGIGIDELFIIIYSYDWHSFEGSVASQTKVECAVGD